MDVVAIHGGCASRMQLSIPEMTSFRVAHKFLSCKEGLDAPSCQAGLHFLFVGSDL